LHGDLFESLASECFPYDPLSIIKMIRALFICTQNRLRSPTAEQVCSQWPGVECASAGVHSSADVPLCAELIEWANMIFVMERAHKNKMAAKFKAHLHGKRVIVLGIPDDYEYMQPSLVSLLESKLAPYLKVASSKR
jgi:predicted protein tyrosine phosphatase